MPGRHILHIDCNAYYASVEMQENPALRGKRIAVCGSKEDRHGIVLTASYPAKRMGVKTGMAIWQAQQCCRDLLIVPPHYREYMRYSGYMREILQDYTDQIEAFGLDESWADVSGSVGLFGSAMTMAQEIGDRVKRELGITVSIGVSNNKVTAKLGSDYKKPDAITRIEADNYQEIVYPLPVQDLLYVGPATQRKLNSYGIRTIGQLAETNPETLRGWFGKVGYSLSAFARGLDASPVARQDHVAAVKSVGNSGTTPRDLVNNEDVWLMLLVMAESVAMRMRELNMKCTVVEVSIRDSDLNGFVRQRKIETPTSSSLEIARIAFELFKSNYRWGKPLRGVGVRGASLVPADVPIQIGFFSDAEKREKLEQLDKAVDVVRERYGYTSVQRARIYTDRGLGAINPKDDHTVHPVGFFNAG